MMQYDTTPLGDTRQANPTTAVLILNPDQHLMNVQQLVTLTPAPSDLLNS